MCLGDLAVEAHGGYREQAEIELEPQTGVIRNLEHRIEPAEAGSDRCWK